jgi:hypothetical protein
MRAERRSSAVAVAYSIRRNGRIFTLLCCTYLLVVLIVFCAGWAKKDTDGVSFILTFLLTLPWSFAISQVPWSSKVLDALTAFYDLPLFVLSALLNIFVAKILRHFLRA